MQLLANGKQQFIDQNGAPLAGGLVYFYQPNTTTPSPTYQDQAGQTANTNPVQLDSSGQAAIWGVGTYRQVVKKSDGTLVWDQLVSTPDVNAPLASLSAASGAALVGFIRPDTGAVARTVQERLRDTLSVKDFGAKGDGVTDDTAAIMAADAAARAAGKALHFPSGTYLASQLIIRTGTNWRGDGRGSTTLQQKTGTNADFLLGDGSTGNWGHTVATTYVDGYTLIGLTIDGNWNSGTGNTAGSGIAVYGCKPLLRDVFIKNVAEHGIRTEWSDNGPQLFGMEGHFDNIRITLVGKHGWWMNGPHDSVLNDVIISGASQALANTYDCFFIDTKGISRLMSCHGYSANSTNHRYAINDQAGCELSAGCHMEGSASANAVFAGASRALVDASCRFYSLTGPVNVIIKSPTTFYGSIEPPYSGTAALAVQLGTSAADNAADCILRYHTVNHGNGAVDFTYSKGGNIVEVSGYAPAGSATYVGTPFSTDAVSMHMDMGGTRFNYTKIPGNIYLTGGSGFTEIPSGPQAGAGTTQATATALPANGINPVTSVPAGSGVVLPAVASFDSGRSMRIFNWGANALLVYPEVGSQIAPLAANAGLSVPAGKSVCMTRVNPTQWGYALSA